MGEAHIIEGSGARRFGEFVGEELMITEAQIADYRTHFQQLSD